MAVGIFSSQGLIIEKPFCFPTILGVFDIYVGELKLNTSRLLWEPCTKHNLPSGRDLIGSNISIILLLSLVFENIKVSFWPHSWSYRAKIGSDEAHFPADF